MNTTGKVFYQSRAFAEANGIAFINQAGNAVFGAAMGRLACSMERFAKAEEAEATWAGSAVTTKLTGWDGCGTALPVGTSSAGSATNLKGSMGIGVSVCSVLAHADYDWAIHYR